MKSMWEDAFTMKKFNFNATRCAFPQHPRWLEICDEVGLVVVDEANIESHGSIVDKVGYLSSDLGQVRMLRITRMYRDKKCDKCHCLVPRE